MEPQGIIQLPHLAAGEAGEQRNGQYLDGPGALIICFFADESGQTLVLGLQPFPVPPCHSPWTLIP